MRVRLVLVFALLALSAPGEEELRIGTRAGPREVTAEDLQALVKRLVPPAVKGAARKAAGEWEKSEAATFTAEARENPELFSRLLIPPGYPRAVPRAETEVRRRAAVILGLSRDRRALQALLDSAVYDPEDTVRLAAAKALRLLDEPVAMRKLVDLAIAADRSKYPWAARKSACVALKRYGDAAAVERLLKELSFELAGGNALDPKNRMRGLASGIGTENPLALPDAPPDLRLSEQDMYPVLSALKEVTGMSFDKGEKDMKTWLGWWKKEGVKFGFKE